TLIVEFRADESGMNKLLALVPTLRDGSESEKWRDGARNWNSAWAIDGAMNVFPFSRLTWRSLAPMQTPISMHIGAFKRGQVVVLWESKSARGVLIQRRY